MSFAAVEQRIVHACERAGRDRSEITLIGASKRQPLDRLRAAYDAGLRCFGENRVQEALSKAPELASDIDWHLIGPLQSNKASRAAEQFSTIHSVDRVKIAKLLNRHAGAANRRLDCFVQINLGSEPTKTGFEPDQARDPSTLLPLFEFEHLRWRGLMAIPPPAESAAAASGWFRALRHLRDELRETVPIGADLSMGMSADYELAIEEGATHIRVGSSLFGARPAP